MRNTVKVENPGKQPNWIMKELGERWNALPDKSKYEELHKDDVARFQRECKEAGVDEDDPRLKRQRTPKKPKGEGDEGGLGAASSSTPTLPPKPPKAESDEPYVEATMEEPAAAAAASSSAAAPAPPPEKKRELPARKKKKAAYEDADDDGDDDEVDEGEDEDEEDDEEDDEEGEPAEPAPWAVPAGFKVSDRPEDALVTAGSAESKTLVGRFVLFHWEGVGWCKGEIKKANMDKRKTVDGDMVNFFVYYEADGDTSRHVLELDNYAPDGPENSWVLLEEGEAEAVVSVAEVVAEPDTDEPGAAPGVAASEAVSVEVVVEEVEVAEVAEAAGMDIAVVGEP